MGSVDVHGRTDDHQPTRSRLHALFLVCMGLGLLGSGCGSTRHTMTAEERSLLGGAESMALVKTDPVHPSADSVLRKKAQGVDAQDPAVALLVERMFKTLEASGGVGLAAPQVGVSRRVVLVKLGTRPAGQSVRVITLVNPVVEWMSDDTQDDYEGCLSLDGVGGLVTRAQAIRLRFERVGGGQEVLELRDWDARIAQHELDHLVGILYVDRMTGALMPTEEARRLRNELHRSRGWLPPESPAPVTPPPPAPESPAPGAS